MYLHYQLQYNSATPLYQLVVVLLVLYSTTLMATRVDYQYYQQTVHPYYSVASNHLRIFYNNREVHSASYYSSQQYSRVLASSTSLLLLRCQYTSSTTTALPGSYNYLEYWNNSQLSFYNQIIVTLLVVAYWSSSYTFTYSRAQCLQILV